MNSSTEAQAHAFVLAIFWPVRLERGCAGATGNKGPGESGRGEGGRESFLRRHKEGDAGVIVSGSLLLCTGVL